MKYTSKIHWQRGDNAFDPKNYDRTHDIQFPGGLSFKASSAPEYAGRAEFPNPEELLTASLASCFMLTFLYVAALKGFIVDDYASETSGTLAKNSEGKFAMTEIVIRPKIMFAENNAPDKDQLDALFKKAHENCFITQSVKANVKVETEAAVA